MAKLIRATVDDKGDVALDFSGFVGNDCLREEQKLSQDMAELGISLREAIRQRKVSVASTSMPRDAKTSL